MARSISGVGAAGLIEGARQILMEGVFDDLTIDRMAASLRISKSTVYKYFDSKEALIRGLVDHLLSSLEGRLRECRTPDDWVLAWRLHIEATPPALSEYAYRLSPSARARLLEARPMATNVGAKLLKEHGVHDARIVACAALAAADAASGAMHCGGDVARERAPELAALMMSRVVGIADARNSSR